jgi:hypothetical protein
MNANFKIWIYAVALIAIIAAGTGFYIKYEIPRNSTSNQQELQDARAILLTASSTQSIAPLTQLLKQNLNSQQQATARLNLGTAYLDTDPTKAAEILKGLSLDESAPPWYRAAAAEMILNYALAIRDAQFTDSVLFTGPVWGEFTRSDPQTPQADLAFRKAFEWASTLYPVFGIEYQIAMWYASTAGTLASSTDTNLYASTALSRIAAGDVDLAAAEKANQAALQQSPDAIPPYTDYEIGLGLSVKARALANLFVLHKLGVLSVSDVQAVYLQAQSYLEKNPQVTGALASALYTRYYFALFLLHIDENTYKQMIVDTLAPIYGAYQTPALRTANFFSYLKSERSTTTAQGQKTPLQLATIKLAGIDPRLKNLLLQLDWPAADFQ